LSTTPADVELPLDHPLVAFYESDRRDVRELLGDHALVIPVRVAPLVTLKRPT
jgi:hypothetical protein